MATKVYQQVPLSVTEQQRSIAAAMSQKLQRRFGKKEYFALVHTFGCQQNVADSERIKGILSQMGFSFTEEPEQADLILFNTCAIRENAEDKVFGNVGNLKQLKAAHPNMIIGLCGCMTEQPHVVEKIKTSYPYVDLVFGTHSLHLLASLLDDCLKKGKRIFDLPEDDGCVAEDLPVRRDGTIKAWLPIMYGCDNFCSYCVVPYVRGRERSRHPKYILSEAQELIAEGYREITLLGQNVNSYGKGLTDPVDFAWLLEQLNALPGDFRIRFMTSHPKDCTHRLIDTIARCEKVCNHIHLPVQSGNDRVLKAMNRHYDRESYLSLIAYARKQIPNVTFTSDIIVGFPGESYEEFCDTLSLLREVKYTSLYTFIFSPRHGTVAEKLPDPVSAQEKGKWFRELLAVQDEIGIAQMQDCVGKTFRVLADDTGKTGEGYLQGRTESNLIVEFPAEKKYLGQFVEVKITSALKWALIGEMCSVSPQI